MKLKTHQAIIVLIFAAPVFFSVLLYCILKSYGGKQFDITEGSIPYHFLLDEEIKKIPSLVGRSGFISFNAAPMDGTAPGHDDVQFKMNLESCKFATDKLIGYFTKNGYLLISGSDCYFELKSIKYGNDVMMDSSYSDSNGVWKVTKYSFL